MSLLSLSVAEAGLLHGMADREADFKTKESSAGRSVEEELIVALAEGTSALRLLPRTAVLTQAFQNGEFLQGLQSSAVTTEAGKLSVAVSIRVLYVVLLLNHRLHYHTERIKIRRKCRSSVEGIFIRAYGNPFCDVCTGCLCTRGQSIARRVGSHLRAYACSGPTNDECRR